MGIDPKADPKRQQPVARVGGKTKSMLYRQIVPSTREPEPFISPVKRVSIDRIDDVIASEHAQVADDCHAVGGNFLAWVCSFPFKDGCRG